MFGVVSKYSNETIDDKGKETIAIAVKSFRADEDGYTLEKWKNFKEEYDIINPQWNVEIAEEKVELLEGALNNIDDAKEREDIEKSLVEAEEELRKAQEKKKGSIATFDTPGEPDQDAAGATQ